jgi:hypothetical protein
MSLSTKSAKPKLKIKLKKSHVTKSVESKLNQLYPNSDLYKGELSYDLDIAEEFKKNMTIDGEEPNMGVINSLPELKLETQIVEDNEQEPDQDNDEDEHNEDNDEDEIDKEALELETVGNKKYYMDYSKGIIYDLQYKSIGNIDEYGEINIA